MQENDYYFKGYVSLKELSQLFSDYEFPEETLEKAAVEAFKLGYEVTDPEELEVEDGDIVICCDILSECALNADLIDAQVEQLMTLAEKFDVEYDGWGTYFEDPNGEDGDDEDFVDEDDDGVRH